MLRSRLVLALTSTLANSSTLGCGSTPPPSTGSERPGESAPSPTPSTPDSASDLSRALAEARTGVDDARLAQLLADHWAFTLEESPTFATRLGVHDFDDRVAEVSPAAIERRTQARRRFLERARAIGDTLSERDRITKALFERELASAEAEQVCRFPWWNVSASDNPVERLNDLPSVHPLRTAEDGKRLVARLRGSAAAIRGEVALLRAGLGEGLVANAESVRRVIAMVDGQLAVDPSAWRHVELLQASEWAAQAPELRDTMIGTIVDDVVPALRAYRDLLADEIAPKARSSKQTGLGALPGGPACYAALVERFTTLPRSPEQVHEIGRQEIARLDREIQTLGRKLFRTRSLARTLARLRSDPALFFADEGEVERAASEALALAQQASPRFFGRLPQAECVVVRVPEFKAPFTTIAYYEAPHADGSKPGEYYINVWQPRTRPRYEARVLAVHESVPGHHLQVAIAQELGDLPAFRRHGGYTVFVEGWALYTERLAEEMGLYRDDLDRMGMLSFDAWRAGRLVVDTGIHAFGWSREQAVAFLTEHTALAPENIDNEVDRYISWPGQALAYKTGQLELWALRRQAEAALGSSFDVRTFHDAVLGAGAVPLDVLKERIDRHIQQHRTR